MYSSRHNQRVYPTQGYSQAESPPRRSNVASSYDSSISTYESRQDVSARYIQGSSKRYNKNKKTRESFKKLPYHYQFINGKMVFNPQKLTLPSTQQFVALDCEMVGVGPHGSKSSLARVTIINFHGQVLLDQHIRQNQPVTDYRTFVSGITKEDLDKATMTPERCRAKVLRLLHNRILVGHALKNDLEVLGIEHPWWMMRDTAMYEPFMNLRGGAYWPQKLKHLAKQHLKYDIQVVGRPHSPYEDAWAALKLYKHVQTNWESHMQFQINQMYLDKQIEEQKQWQQWERYQRQQEYQQQVYQQQQYFMQRGYNKDYYSSVQVQ